MEMRELIDERAANLVMLVLAFALPVAGVLVGAAVGAGRGRAASGALRGLAVGALGIANWLLWRLYNAITDRLGLDTVKNLVVNLVLFLVVGIAVGVLSGLWAKSKHEA